MNSLPSAWQSVKAFIVRYPAVLSGYIIYAYLFLCILRFFILVQAGEASLIRTYETFIAVPFLWLLSFSLVKVIEIRARLHDSETHRQKAQLELDAKHLQLATLRQVVRGLQDKVNNPLSVIAMSADKIEQSLPDHPPVIAAAEDIRHSVHRISEALQTFQASEEYHVSDLGSGIGNIAVP